jgi:hypothetical protein
MRQKAVSAAKPGHFRAGQQLGTYGYSELIVISKFIDNKKFTSYWIDHGDLYLPTLDPAFRRILDKFWGPFF